MQQDLQLHYAATAPGLVQVLGVDLWNGTPAQLGQFKVQTGATYPLALSGASATGGNVEALVGTYDNYVVLDAQGVVRYHAALTWPHGNRYHLGEIRAVVDPLVAALLDAPGAPGTTALSIAAGPRPARGSVRVTLTLPTAARAWVRVLDVSGREVARLHAGALAAGEHRWTWEARAAAAGLYWAEVEAGDVRKSARIVLTR